jgi:N-acetylglutamate synthase-like GNAT family acetyltransferase
VGAETIRSARPEDLGAVMELWGGARSSHAITEDTRARVERAIEAILVAEVDGAIVGAVIAAFDGWRGNFYRLAVEPALRRRGIGARLVAAGEERLRALGAPRVSALVAFEDADARGFWEAVGYGADPDIGRMVKTI